MAMAYGSFSLEPVGAHRVNPVPPVAASLRVAARAEGRTPARGGAVDAPAQAPAPAVEIPPLSATALRAQAVSGLLEARRTDLVGAERAVGQPGAAARRSLADVWPEEDRDRPDARAAAEVSLTRDDDGASSRKRSDKARREAAIRADLITQAAVAEAAASAAALAEAQAERAERADRARSMDDEALATHARAQDAQARRATAMAGAGRVAAAPAEPAEDEAPERDDAAPPARREVTLADVARAADDVRRLRDAVTSYARTLREGIERGAAEVSDLATRVAELNGRISDAVDSGRPVPEDASRQREQLIVSLARLTGATIQPGARSSIDVLVDGRTLVSGEQSWPLVTATGVDGKERLGFADGRGVSLSSGVLASRLGTHNGMLATLAGASSAVLSLLAEQAADPAGAGVVDGSAAAAGLGGLLREVAHAAESSAAYAQVAAGVENLVSRLAQGDVPAVVRGSNLLLGAVDGSTVAAAPRPPSAASMGSLRAALSELGKATAEAAVPGATAPTTRVTSGAPGLATPIVAGDAATGLATVRVLSVAAGGAVTTAQSFHPDTPLGDGRETTIGIVQGLGTPLEHTTVIDVGRYPTPADLVSSINQSSVEVRASLNRLTGGTVQLHVESLRTGRGQNITIVNGSQPPAASQVLGRFVQLTAARDTMLEVQQAGRTAAVMSSSSTTVADVLPGVSLDVHRAEPSRAFQIGLSRQAGPAVATAESLVHSAGAAMTAARAAGAPGTAEAVLAALGLGGTPSTGTPGAGAETLDAAGRLGARAAIPGVHLDRRGNPALDRRELTEAFEADPAGTSGAVTATARALSAVAANTDGATWEAYLTARAAQGPDPLATYTADTRRTGRDDAVATELSRREQALLAVLNRLQDQGEWLGGQLAAGTA